MYRVGGRRGGRFGAWRKQEPSRRGGKDLASEGLHSPAKVFFGSSTPAEIDTSRHDIRADSRLVTLPLGLWSEKGPFIAQVEIPDPLLVFSPKTSSPVSDLSARGAQNSPTGQPMHGSQVLEVGIVTGSRSVKGPTLEGRQRTAFPMHARLA